MADELIISDAYFAFKNRADVKTESGKLINRHTCEHTVLYLMEGIPHRVLQSL